MLVEHLSELERELLVLDAQYYELDELLELLGADTEMAAKSAPATGNVFSVFFGSAPTMKSAVVGPQQKSAAPLTHQQPTPAHICQLLLFFAKT